jgi:hypothetical protein
VWISLKEAAAILDYSPSGLRKLVRRREIRFFQIRKHSPVKFRKEWLDAFIDEHSSAPGQVAEISAVIRKKKAPPLTSGAHGFDVSRLR